MSKNFLRQEFIGLKAKVLTSRDPSLKGIEGIIIDETKNMLIIETNKGIKKIAKDIATFEIAGNIVNGKKIKYRPEERIGKIK